MTTPMDFQELERRKYQALNGLKTIIQNITGRKVPAGDFKVYGEYGLLSDEEKPEFVNSVLNYYDMPHFLWERRIIKAGTLEQLAEKIAKSRDIVVDEDALELQAEKEAREIYSGLGLI